MFGRLAFATALVCLAGSDGLASPGECLLRVGQRTYLDGPCNIVLEAGGSFTIWRGKPQHRSGYLAAVILNPAEGVGYGHWNGRDVRGPADQELGAMVRAGGCWANNAAKVCAWRPGTRPR
jgi:hypothetical protein